MKAVLAIGMILVVGWIFYYFYSRILKPLRRVSVDSELRKELVKLVEADLFPLLKVGGQLSLERRKIIERISDMLFDRLVREFTDGDDMTRYWFYYQKGDGIGSIVESELKEIELEYEVDPLVLVVIGVYRQMSEFSRGHVDAEHWTAFGFLSWVNLNIDQIIEGHWVESED